MGGCYHSGWVGAEVILALNVQSRVTASELLFPQGNSCFSPDHKLESVQIVLPGASFVLELNA